MSNIIDIESVRDRKEQKRKEEKVAEIKKAFKAARESWSAKTKSGALSLIKGFTKNIKDKKNKKDKKKK